MLEHFYLSVLLFSTAIVICIIVFLSNIRLAAKITIAILLVVSGAFTYRAFNEIQGFPVVLQQTFDDVLVISYMLDVENKVIHLWLKSEGDKSPRSYTVPYSDKLANILEGMRRRHQGRPYRAKLDATSDPTSPLNQSIRDVQINELMIFPPKN